VAVGQLLAVRGEVQFRAAGGDDDQMPWHRVVAVPPPVIENLQVTLAPPAYTHRPVERLPEGVGHVQGLMGTRVEISARSSKAVDRAILRIKDQERHKVQVGEDGQTLQAAFIIGEAGIHSWWLELKDPQGFEDAEPPRHEVRGLQDFEPEIYIEQPAADMQVTADAVVPVRTVARDDLGLSSMRLVYKIEPAETAEEQDLSLFAPALFAPGREPGGELPLAHTAEYQWRLTDLRCQPGARIIFHTEATDEFDLSAEFPKGKAPAPHVGRSVTRTLTIVSPADKALEIAQRQEGILNDLERNFKLEQQAHAQVDDLLVQIENTDRFRPEDLDTLQRTEMGQREIASQLGNSANGLEKRARDLAEELRNNRIDDPQTERRLQRVADELARLGREHLRPLEQELTRARKLAQAGDRLDPRKSSRSDASKKKSAPRTPTDRPDDALRKVSENQDAVLESIGEMLQDLSQWRGEHDAARELTDIIRQQADLNQKSAELAKTTLTRPADALAPQEQADLAKIAERQKRQADQLEQLEAKMRGTIENLAAENPSAAAALQEAVEQSQQEGIAGEMRDAAGQLGENRMGQAARTQEEVLRKLRDLEDTLRQKRESDTEMMVKKLKQAAAELQDLHDRQAELLRKTKEAGGNENSPERDRELAELRKQQQRLREETARMARRLARLDAQHAETSASLAAGRMQQAENQLGEGGHVQAEEQQQEALDDLEQAQRELARQLRMQEEQLARELLARVADELRGMIPRQQAVIEETRRLDGLHAESGKWTRGQLVSLRDLARTQQALEEDTVRLVDKLANAEVFALGLKGAARHMHSAAEQLAERQTGAPTQKIQQSAQKRLTDLVDALEPDAPDRNAGGQPSPEQAGGGGQGAPPADGIPTLAQVKMLLSLQRELFTRTAEIERLRGRDGKLPAAAQTELEAIAAEQGELADLARNLSAISSPNDAEEADPGAVNEKSQTE
jgi:hypothetical protein